MNFETLRQNLNADTDSLGDALDYLGIELKDDYSQEEFNQLSTYLNTDKVLTGVKEHPQPEQLGAQTDSTNKSQKPFDLDKFDSMPDELKLALAARLAIEVPTKNAGQALVNQLERYWDEVDNNLENRIVEVNCRRTNQFYQKAAFVTLTSVPDNLKNPQLEGFEVPKFTGKEAYQIPGTSELLALAPRSVQELLQ